MFKKIALRASLAATAIGVSVALLPSAASVLNLGPIVPVVATNGTAVHYDMAPTFKVIGNTSCAPTRSGNLWQATKIIVDGVKGPESTSVRVTLGSHTYTATAATNWEATIPTADSFACDDLDSGYTGITGSARSYKSNGGADGPAVDTTLPFTTVD